METLKARARSGVAFGDPPGTLRVPGPPDDFWPEVGQEKPTLETGGRRLVFGQLLRVLVCSGTGPESSTGSPDLLVQAALAARLKIMCTAKHCRQTRLAHPGHSSFSKSAGRSNSPPKARARWPRTKQVAVPP